MDITNDAITYDNQVIPTRNVSSAMMVERQVEKDITDLEYNARRKKYLAIAVGALVIYGYYSHLPIVYILILSGIAIVILRPRQRKTTVWEYGVRLETNGGSVSLLWSPDEPFIKQLREVIFKAISSSGSSVQYTVNVDNREIHDNSQNTFNTTNNYDYSVSFTHHHGLGPNDLEFLTGAFNDAMNELGSKLEGAGSEVVVAELKRLRAELNKKEPDKAVLQKLYDKLKGAYDLTETATKTTGLLGTIWAGISLFT